LLPVRVLSRLFRRLFLTALEAAFDEGALQFFTSLEPLHDRSAFVRYLAPARHTEWVVYAKPPFAGPERVLDYVGRYTHRVAISNARLVDMDDGHVRFRYKDYRQGGHQQQTMRLAAPEFIRRVLLHVLPSGFQRIRYYGFLANRARHQKVAHCRHLLAMPSPPEPVDKIVASVDYRDRYEALTGCSLRVCPRCYEGQMLVIEHLVAARRGPTIPDTS
jgi:hypothetical protein